MSGRSARGADHQSAVDRRWSSQPGRLTNTRRPAYVLTIIRILPDNFWPLMTTRSLASRRQFRTALLLGAALSLTACGKSLGTKITETVDGCLAARNPQFVSGAGAKALDTPLSPALRQLASAVSYGFTLPTFVDLAETAPDQVTLVCALEIASFYRDPDVAVLLTKFSKHPDASVSVNAKRLLATQDPLPARLQ